MANSQGRIDEMTKEEAHTMFAQLSDDAMIKEYSCYSAYEKGANKAAEEARKKLRRKTEQRRLEVLKLPAGASPYLPDTYATKHEQAANNVREYDEKLAKLRADMEARFLEAGAWRKLKLGIKPYAQQAQDERNAAIQAAKQAQRDAGRRTSSEERADRKADNRKRNQRPTERR